MSDSDETENECPYKEILEFDHSTSLYSVKLTGRKHEIVKIKEKELCKYEEGKNLLANFKNHENSEAQNSETDNSETENSDSNEYENNNFDNIDTILLANDDKYCVLWKGHGFEDITWEIKVDDDSLNLFHERKKYSFPSKQGDVHSIPNNPIPFITNDNINNYRNNNLHSSKAQKNSKNRKKSKILSQTEIVTLNKLIYCFNRQRDFLIRENMGIDTIQPCIEFLRILQNVCDVKGPYLIVTDDKKWHEKLHDLPEILPLFFEGNDAGCDKIREIYFIPKSETTLFHALIVTPERLLNDLSLISQICFKVAIFHSANARNIYKKFHTIDIGINICITKIDILHSAQQLDQLTDYFKSNDMKGQINTEFRYKATTVNTQIQPIINRISKHGNPSFSSPEIISVNCPLSEIQKKMCKSILTKYSRNNSNNNNSQIILEKILRICSHPFLIVNGEYDLGGIDFVQASTKLQVLDAILQDCQKYEYSLLVISNYQEMIEMISDLLEMHEIYYKNITDQFDYDDHKKLNTEQADVYLYNPRFAKAQPPIENIQCVVIFDGKTSEWNDILLTHRSSRTPLFDISAVYYLECLDCCESELYSLCESVTYNPKRCLVAINTAAIHAFSDFPCLPPKELIQNGLVYDEDRNSLPIVSFLQKSDFAPKFKGEIIEGKPPETLFFSEESKNNQTDSQQRQNFNSKQNSKSKSTSKPKKINKNEDSNNENSDNEGSHTEIKGDRNDEDISENQNGDEEDNTENDSYTENNEKNEINENKENNGNKANNEDENDYLNEKYTSAFFNHHWTIHERNLLVRGLSKIGYGRWEEIQKISGLYLPAKIIEKASLKLISMILKMSGSSTGYNTVRSVLKSAEEKGLVFDFPEDSIFNDESFLERLGNISSLLVKRLENLFNLANSLGGGSITPDQVPLFRLGGGLLTEWWTEEHDKALAYITWKFGLGSYDHYSEYPNDIYCDLFMHFPDKIEHKRLLDRALKLCEISKRTQMSDQKVIENLSKQPSRFSEQVQRQILQYLLCFGIDEDEKGRQDFDSIADQIHGMIGNDIQEYVDYLHQKITETESSGGLSYNIASRVIQRISAMSYLRKMLRYRERFQRTLTRAPKWRNLPKKWTPQIEFLYFEKLEKKGFGKIQEILEEPEISIVFENNSPPSRILQEDDIVKRITSLYEFRDDSMNSSRNRSQNSDNYSHSNSSSSSYKKKKKKDSGSSSFVNKKFIVPSLEELTHNVHFPVAVTQNSEILELGKIVTDRSGFHSERYIYPAGYRSTRQYADFRNPRERVTYVSEIVDNGGDSPLFKVYPEDDPTVGFKGETPSSPWVLLIKKVSQIKGEKRKSNTISGPEAYLLSNPITIYLIQQLPGAKDLEKYVWKKIKGAPDEDEDEED
ncbi:hypothetical protein TRFO_14009 [Tritrichomonas foetus]|uniref:Uncharacterized protein n=1 Tax=Tritrichomonas foetus TaxID=1144522 RepID=A0A1J4L0Z5_9EUKA|nr:hypothetical protein TRFO_14009 [Tritrichomonas foetus]|eukprot:OHT15638.1 hypothetical protein TRFO_14009 [Tritrichomonas foetus]